MFRIKYSGRGMTREVFLIGQVAIKIPCLHRGWKMFLHGLLANMQEKTFAGYSPILCPVHYANRFGLVLVMTRAEPLSLDDFKVVMEGTSVRRKGHEPVLSKHEGIKLFKRDRHAFYVEDLDGNRLPADFKRDNFGRIGGRLVMIDYGS